MTSEQPPSAVGSRPSRGLVLTVAAVLVVLLAVVATAVLWPDDGKPAAAPPPPSPTATPTPTPTPTPTKPPPPYAFFPVGACFDHPQLSPVITKPEERPCAGDHDGEVIADLKLADGLTGEIPLALAMRDGCKEAEAAAKARQGDGKTYYGRQFGPAMANYQQGWRDYTCTLAASNKQGGPKLTGQLHP
ncbi:hypothetical protein [Kitasatospora xanthocidica]|uniref:hypothetical protein n=1 Tax=Kitasatospora xanthocidica TaxID=83382 RepID=UPI0015F3368B|nr:hypothetical protein [Kitasatospora xanthocidica]